MRQNSRGWLRKPTFWAADGYKTAFRLNWWHWESLIQFSVAAKAKWVENFVEIALGLPRNKLTNVKLMQDGFTKNMTSKTNWSVNSSCECKRDCVLVFSSIPSFSLAVGAYLTKSPMFIGCSDVYNWVYVEWCNYKHQRRRWFWKRCTVSRRLPNSMFVYCQLCRHWLGIGQHRRSAMLLDTYDIVRTS